MTSSFRLNLPISLFCVGEEMKESKVIDIKPKVNVKSALDGRVFYEHVNTTGASAESLRAAGERVAMAFPDFEVWVTCGPFRMYDVKFQIDFEQKIIALDFYSVRPGFRYLDKVIEEIGKEIEHYKKHR